MNSTHTRTGVAIALVLLLIGGTLIAIRSAETSGRTTVTAYFENSNGIFAGDDVLILGVPVGKVAKIEPEPLRAKITFWFDNAQKVPADAHAVVLSPQLVTGRAIQLTPAYTGGPLLDDAAVIEQDRTAVPVSWDDFRVQLERLTQTLQPTEPGGVSELGAFINTAADNLRGQGGSIREALIALSQTFSTLGDHSGDIFATLKNLSILVSALHDSTGLMTQLNRNLAAVSELFANDPNEVGDAAQALYSVAGEVRSFVADNREALGTTSDTLSSISTALVESLDDIEQTLHIAPTTLANFNNIYEPANGSLTGALAINNFDDPIGFICGAIQAASRMNAEQSAKLCVQYLAPIVKNRQFNFPPIGINPFVGATARPNEITYSEEWLRPDYIPPTAAGSPQPPALPAEAPEAVPVDPAAGLLGLMGPKGAGS